MKGKGKGKKGKIFLNKEIIKSVDLLWTFFVCVVVIGREKKKVNFLNIELISLLWTARKKNLFYYKAAKEEGNVLYNDVLNTFYLRLYGIRHMVKNHSDSERKPAVITYVTPD